MVKDSVKKMGTCIFCDIIKQKVSCFEVYRDEYVTAFLDINPVTSGHTLIIPNKHIERLDYLDEPGLSNALMSSLIKVSQILIKSGICDDFTVLSDNGDQAQQDIKHIHFHIIPRHSDENFSFKLYTDHIAAEKNNLLQIWEKIKRKQID
ncbi:MULTISPECIES: HIT family protein [Bacillus]|nr:MULTISPECIES: HIT domain-containing protein [Bacillus]